MKSNAFFNYFILFLFFSLSQGIRSQVDTKYLKGAVPEINGKIIFSDTIPLPGKNQNEIYEKVLQWAEANYNTNQSRVVFIDKEKGNIACKGYDTLVFSSGALSLDRTFMNYQLIIYCMNNMCRYDLRSISYEYNVSNKKEPEKYTAEEWISDKEAVNKNKLYRNNGKFRIKTIDLVDDIYNSLSMTLNTGETDLYTNKEKNNRYSRQPIDNQQTKATAPANIPVSDQSVKATVPEERRQTGFTKQIIPAQETLQVETASPVAPANMQGYKRMEPEKIPGNIIRMLSNDWMLITAGNDTKYDMMTTTWGGLGVLFDKPVAFCFISPAQYTYELMESKDTYTLSFYTEAYRDALRYCETASGKDTDKVKGSGLTPITLPSGCKSFGEAWMIIECKKLLAQPVSAENIQDKQVKEEQSKSSMHKMYAGEILNVWVK